MARSRPPTALADYEALAASKFFAAALDRGDIVATERVADGAPIPGEWAAVLRHDRIGVLSYPYEWSFEMLRDAARLQLTLTRRGARRVADHQGRQRLQRAVRRQQAGVHRRRLVREAAQRRAMGRLSPVLRAVPQSAVRPGVARRAVPAVAPRQHRRDHPRRRGGDHRQTRPLPQGRCSPTSGCTPAPNASTPTPIASATSAPS